MSEMLGQQVVIENVGGAGGMTGSARVAQSPPDGYTFVLGTVGTHAQGQTLYKKPLYNAATDFTPVALIAEVPIVLIARKDLPASNLKEFVDYTKKNQDKMTFGSAGTGSATHLGCVVLNTAIGVPTSRMCPIAAPARRCRTCRADASTILCEIITTAKPQIDGGTVKAIAILTKQRSPALPNLPTAAEQGVPNVEAYTWNAIFLPKGTPDAIVKKLHDAALAGDEDAGRQGASGGARRHDRVGRPRHAAISRQVRQERDREVGGADQGERRDRGLSGSF